MGKAKALLSGPASKYRGKIHHLTIRLTVIGMACLKAACHQTGDSQSDHIDTALREWSERHGGKA